MSFLVHCHPRHIASRRMLIHRAVMSHLVVEQTIHIHLSMVVGDATRVPIAPASPPQSNLHSIDPMQNGQTCTTIKWFMIVLMAMAFQAGLNPPGGCWSSTEGTEFSDITTSNPLQAGEPKTSLKYISTSTPFIQKVLNLNLLIPFNVK